MAPILPILPALLALTATVVQVATAKDPPGPPGPQRLDKDTIDQELIDAQRRKGRQIFAGDQTLLQGGQIGADRTLGLEQTLVSGT